MTRSSTVSIFWVISSSSTILMSAGFTTIIAPTPSHHRMISQNNDDISCVYLSMAKNSDRAHIERNLEQMMGDDWRLFRAKLIAQEAIEAADTATSSIHNKLDHMRNDANNSKNKSNNNNNNSDEKSKHSQLSDLFTGAINSIFHSNHNNDNTNKNKSKSSNKKDNIFHGDTIGGASLQGRQHHDFDSAVDSSKFMSSLCSPTSSSTKLGGRTPMEHNDPFVSEEELPCHMKPIITKISKHRWAHEISHIETGCVLIANEKLGGVFHQTVVLIVQHSDKSGSVGIVINR
jgi:putative transcriptional regulator